MISVRTLKMAVRFVPAYAAASFVAAFLTFNTALAQKPPQAIYAFPGGARAGQTIDVQLGGYDMTPDVQYFLSDPHVTFKVVSGPGEILITPPPYWFGPKGRNPAIPVPRQTHIQMTIPADMPEGPIDWQVANANGASAPSPFWISHLPEVQEVERRRQAQPLPAFPLVVNGRVAKVEEVDKYSFSVDKPTLITCELFCRRLGVQKMYGVLEVRDENNKLVADAADTAGKDLEFSFAAQPKKTYTLHIHDLDFNGDWSFVYRLRLTTGPRVLAMFPAAGKRGETQQIKFVGRGVATGSDKLESVTKPVTFPSEPGVNAFDYKLETPFGNSQNVEFQISDLSESVEPDRADASAAVALTLPAAVTGTISRRGESDRYTFTGKKGEEWDIFVGGRQSHTPFDAMLLVTGPDGKEIGRNDDAGVAIGPAPGKRPARRVRGRGRGRGNSSATTDAAYSLKLPADGIYTVAINDLSSLGGSPVTVYRLTIQAPKKAVVQPDFTFDVPRLLNLPHGGKVTLPLKVSRTAGFDSQIDLTITGLPEGVTTPTKLVIPAKKSDLAIELQCAATAGTAASPLRFQGTAKVGAGNLSEQSAPVLLATTMKPRCFIQPENRDGSATVHRGTTYPAPMVIKRLEGYTGEVILQMSSNQTYQQQGMRGADVIVPPGETTAHFNVFTPEWLEIDRTSRMLLIGVCKVPDPKGQIRYIVTQLDGRIGMSLEGSLLRLVNEAGELTVKAGTQIEIPIKLFRSPKLPLPVKLELVLEPEQAGLFQAEVLNVAPEQQNVTFRILSTADKKIVGEQVLKIRGTAYQAPDLPVVSEVEVPVEYLAP